MTKTHPKQAQIISAATNNNTAYLEMTPTGLEVAPVLEVIVVWEVIVADVVATRSRVATAKTATEKVETNLLPLYL